MISRYILYSRYKKIFLIFAYIVCLLNTAPLSSHDALVIDTLYGSCTITEPIIIELLEHPMMLRLKEIHQYGVDHYVIKESDYNRYDHSVGVFMLLRKFNRPLNEQVAGLLHDISHTVFSHVGDWIFGKGDQINSYQDDHHEQFLKESGIENVLQKHGFSIEDIHHKDNHAFQALEQPLPDICADRLEYNLRGGLIERMLTHDDIKAIVEDIQFQDGTWFFTHAELAKKFALCPLYMTEHVWTSPASVMISSWTGSMLKIALDKHILSYDEIHFSTDDHVWRKLTACNEYHIAHYLQKIMSYKDHIHPGTPLDYDIHTKVKFRGVNPLILVEGNLVRLTDIDLEFKTEFERIKNITQTGWYIKFLS